MDKQMIEEMAMKLIMAGDLCRRMKDCDECKYSYIVDSKLCESHLMAEELLKYYQPKIPEGAIVLTREEYDRLKRDAERYNPFWFCTFGGCEGICSDCKDTCEMSIFVKERKETAKEILQEGKYCLSKSSQDWIKERFGVEVE